MQTHNPHILERGAAFLQSPEILARMDAQTQADIKAGKKEFYLADFYARKKLPGFAGIIDIIKETDNLKCGVTSLDKGKLPDNAIMALCSVGISYGYEAAITDKPSEQRYASSEYLNTIPTKVLNSEFKLLNGDKKLLAARTKKFFANAYADFGSEANDENAVILPQPKLILSDKRIKAQFEFAEDGLAAPANAHYIELRLTGVVVADRI